MALIPARIRKAGNSYVVTIPAEEMKARGLREGHLVDIDPVPVEIRPIKVREDTPVSLRSEVRAAADRVWARHAAGLRHLAGR
jgi:antitoxin component of MazEF toxin-antitoxin module